MLARRGSHRDLFGLVDRSLGLLVGHKLFTILLARKSEGEVIRVYSSRPDVYPVSRAKKMGRTPWGEMVLETGRPFIGRNAQDMRWAFSDHELLSSIGCESALNVPVVIDGQALGTVNLLDGANWYQERHVALVTPFAYLLAEKFSSILSKEGLVQ